MSVNNLSSFKRILIINIFGIGDVLFTTPLISNIKRKFPKSFIGYLCNKRTQPFLKHHPRIDRIFVYEKDDYRQIFKKSKIKFLKKIREALTEIKRENIDIVIDVSLNGMVSFLMMICGIKERVGFNYKNRSLFLTQKIPLKGYEGKHVVEHYLDLLKSIDIDPIENRLEIFIPPEDKKYAQEKLGEIKGRKIAIVPGGGASWGKDARYKRFPLEKYSELVDKMIEKYDANVILMGDNGEASLCRGIWQLKPQKIFDLSGQTTITQMAAVFKQCQLVIVNDGGPLHVAVAAGARTISIFGPVDEKVYGPYPQDQHVVVTKAIACRPCYRRFKRVDCDHITCLTKLNVQEILKEVERIL